MATNDYKKKTFNRAMRGYNTEEVDEYIDYLSQRCDELSRENTELENKLKAALDQKYASARQTRGGQDSIRRSDAGGSFVHDRKREFGQSSALLP